MAAREVPEAPVVHVVLGPTVLHLQMLHDPILHTESTCPWHFQVKVVSSRRKVGFNVEGICSKRSLQV